MSSMEATRGMEPAKSLGPASKHPLYGTWRSMIRRCVDKNHEAYPRYGGRGVTVCKRWTDSFWAFVEDVSPKPPGTELDRADNASGYAPSNVRWVTPFVQNRNKRNNVWFEHNGQRLCMADLAREYRISPSVLRTRLVKMNWPLEKALSEPVKPDGGRFKSKSSGQSPPPERT